MTCSMVHGIPGHSIAAVPFFSKYAEGHHAR